MPPRVRRNPSKPAAGKVVPFLIDPEDGRLDVSKFIDQAYGFVPIVMPITEPAVGYGAAGGLVFIDRPEQQGEAGFRRPNITAVGGLATENGTWGAMVGDMRYWLDDRLQTLAGFVYAPVNLDFYGIGDGFLRENPLSYSLTPTGGLLKAKYRLGEKSQWWAGLGYSFFSTEVKFNLPASVPPGIAPAGGEFRTGGLTPSVSFDSRDNFFTPTSGIFAEASLSAFSKALGSDTEFQKAAFVAIGYVPLAPKLTLGLRSDVSASFGEAPFYLGRSFSCAAWRRCAIRARKWRRPRRSCAGSSGSASASWALAASGRRGTTGIGSRIRRR